MRPAPFFSAPTLSPLASSLPSSPFGPSSWAPRSYPWSISLPPSLLHSPLQPRCHPAPQRSRPSATPAHNIPLLSSASSTHRTDSEGNPRQRHLPRTANMCRYYAHSHNCGHTNTVFAAYCPPAALKQRPCSGGEIWQTLKMDHACSTCNVNGDSGPAVANAKKAKAKAAAARR